ARSFTRLPSRSRHERQARVLSGAQARRDMPGAAALAQVGGDRQDRADRRRTLREGQHRDRPRDRHLHHHQGQGRARDAARGGHPSASESLGNLRRRRPLPDTECSMSENQSASSPPFAIGWTRKESLAAARSWMTLRPLGTDDATEQERLQWVRNAVWLLIEAMEAEA